VYGRSIVWYAANLRNRAMNEWESSVFINVSFGLPATFLYTPLLSFIKEVYYHENAQKRCDELIN